MTNVAVERLKYRDALRVDVPDIVALLADDMFGQNRNPAFEAAREAYEAAFAEMAADPNNGLVLCALDGRIAAVTQLTFIRGLSYSGGLRAQIESVRVAADLRGLGIGAALMGEAVRRARARSCVLVQLTTDVRRPQTRSFYERLGFQTSHHGMKLWL